MTAAPCCGACGAALEPESVYCSFCGARLVERAKGEEVRCAVHPELKAIRPCPRCGTFACGECLVRSALDEWLCAACHERSPDVPLPWDLRGEVGHLKAFFRTCWLLLKAPSRSLRAAPRAAPISSSVLFAVLANVASVATTCALYVLMAVVAQFRSDAAGGAREEALMMLVGAVSYLVLAPGIGLAAMFVLGGLDHLVLRAVGAKPGGFPVTLRAVALSSAPMVLGLIPLCGCYVFPLWGLVLKVLAYRALHRTSGWKAAAGGLAVSGGLLLAFAGLMALVIRNDLRGLLE
ncbi:MAG: YIP1 family protein [Myxococcales bacterium]|nr:YIP1 family protein [Myxococcales bacterium]